ncbi:MULTISPECIES: ESX secretion-associated protein EspG [unclassified Crossiella]|uniref:ESX secretion-associated protein EspG n=1 Tax=unclassified Crossiella TaxID=2620835 RepID=UPI001FFE49EE|nr:MULTISPECIES: ESX secretion-associated protein EspG [unclassified Crossiella]MCK2237105.1 ESX secretion-associated protein EspG [Crossiella sp. S99.2]MCK2250773.1 ESX secretion-associated protein EspG [Crossiella sp. S99.1]
MSYFSREPLSRLAFSTLWQAVHEDRPQPVVLDVAPETGDYPDRAASLRQGMDELAAKGYRDDRRIAEDVLALVRLLAEHSRSLDLRLIGRGGWVRALAAAGGPDRAGLAVLTPAGLTLREVRDTGLATALLAELPEHPRGTLRQLSVPTTQLRAFTVGGPDPWDRPLSKADRGVLAPLVADPVVRRAQIGGTVRAGWDTPRRIERQLLVNDGERCGRHLVYAVGTHTTLVRADPKLLARTVGELLDPR